MLDSMVTAVDESVSYDGIVSVPETGLEDVKSKSSVASSLRVDVDQVRMTSAATSRGAGRAARVLKKKRHHNPNQSASEGSIRYRSDSSFAPSDQQSGCSTDGQDERLSASSAAHSETDERNHFAREQAATQRYRFIERGSSSRSSISRTRPKPISVEGSPPSHPEQRKVKEAWYASPVTTSPEESPAKNGEELGSWGTRFKEGFQRKRASGQRSDVNQVRSPENVQSKEKESHANSNLEFSLNASQVMAGTERRWTPGIGAFKQWMYESSIDIDKPFLRDDSPASASENVLAHNALLHIHSRNWSSAYRDAKKSVDIRPSTVGYIAKALAQIGNGEPEKAIQTFDLVFWNSNPDESKMLLLVKTIVLFVAGKCDEAISRVHDLIDVSSDDGTMYCCNKVLARMYLMRENFECAVHSLQQAQAFAPPHNECHLESISLVFRWSFEGLEITVRQRHCEALHAAGRTEEASEALHEMLKNFDGKICANKETEEWIADFKNKCVDRLEVLGDVALSSGEHGEAIARYSSALSLNPSKPIDILLKRSKARASKGLWEVALTDAEEVIKLDPASHRGYERKCMALHGAENYGEANNALLHMFSIIEKSPDEETRRLRENYTTPFEAIDAIDTATHEIFHLCPLVLIDLTTGRLCDAHERLRMFHLETPFQKLVSEIALAKLDYPRVRQTVAKHFKWIMFSHTWGGEEPTFQDVNLVDSVWSLDQSPLNEKLRQFCTTAREDGHRWAWSDTCCIDKTTSAILSQSLTSMYRWYEEAAETLVYLADVLSSSELGDLTKSRWMTRAWTLQELLASKVIRFYNRDWKLYLNDIHRNHKESPSIRQELAQAMGVAPETIIRFHPEDLGVREKLRLASTRNATREEDIAYSLIGIFSSNIRPQYGLGKIALGELLENIVDRTGDVTAIAWAGKSLPYNSALPDSLAVYNQIPYRPPPMEADELDACVEQLRTRLTTREDAVAFYHEVIRLRRATFSNRCLQLPCIVFPVKKIGVQDLHDSQDILYRAIVSLLGRVEFRTADTMPLKTPQKLVFVHPWLYDLRDPLDEFVSDDEQEIEPDVRSDAGSSNSTDDSYASAPVTPLLAEPSIRVDHYRQALRLIARLGHPFNALLFERQTNGQYKRVATEHEIRISGVPYQTNPKGVRAKVLEIV